MIFEALAGSISRRSGSPENPATSLANPASWLWDAFGATTSDTGVEVSPQTALQHSGYLACIRVISETLAALPLKVYRRLDDDGRELARDRPVYNLLHDRPNDLMSSFTFREVLQQHLLGWGNAYAELEYNKKGELVALWPILPDRTKVWIEMRPGGRPAKWLTTRVDNEERVFKPGTFIHIPGIGFDGITGYSPLHMYRNAVGLALATEKFGARWFAGGGKPPVVLKTERVLNSEAIDRLRQQWERMHGNLESSQRAVILDEGMDLQAIGVPPDDSQFLQTRKFQISEMARIFRVPPHKIGDLERATFSNIEQQGIEFVQDTILPWCSRWESYLSHDLFDESERGTYYAEFVLDGLLRGDSKMRAESNAILRQWGVLSANEWRKGENLDPIEGGDDYLVPLNFQTLGDRTDEDVVDAEVVSDDGGSTSSSSSSDGETVADEDGVVEGVNAPNEGKTVFLVGDKNVALSLIAGVVARTIPAESAREHLKILLGLDDDQADRLIRPAEEMDPPPPGQILDDFMATESEDDENDELDEEPGEDDEPRSIDAALMDAVLLPVLVRATERVVVQEARQLERILSRHGGDLEAMDEDVTDLLVKLELWLERELEAFSESLAAAGLIDNPAEWIVLSIERHVEDTRSRLARAAADGRLEDEIKTWHFLRADEIARAEMRRLRDVA